MDFIAQSALHIALDAELHPFLLAQAFKGHCEHHWPSNVLLRME
jgi:hypothetical protein